MLSKLVRANPFYQPARQWQIRISIGQIAVATTEEVFEDVALAISSFEVSEDSHDWYTDIITDVKPEKLMIDERLALVVSQLAITMPAYEIKEIVNKDWVSEVERSFPPLHIGRFYVHGSHVKKVPPHGKIALKVNAGAAFGSGEHSTTSGCLMALGILAKKRRFRRPLDMGCGSGILALAMAKLWHVPVTAIDIDPVSAITSKENARNNKAHTLLKVADGFGYRTMLARKNAPYDIIVANILARPLMKMAPDLKRNLSKGGFVILSGLLAKQERMVLSAHKAQGLHLVGRVKLGCWNTLILRS